MLAYRIQIRGHLSDDWAPYFDGLTVLNQPNGTATIHGPVKDQAQLHAILTRIFNLGLTLLGVEGGASTASVEPVR